MHGQLRVAVGFFLLSACSGPVEPDLSEASRLHVSHLPPETCRLSFDGKAFDLRTQEREAIRSLRARSGSREAVIDFDVTVQAASIDTNDDSEMMQLWEGPVATLDDMLAFAVATVEQWKVRQKR